MFINPIELLGLDQNTGNEHLSPEGIKRAKRRLFADIDLSDSQTLTYHKRQLTKTECEAAIETLQDPDSIDYYYYLTANSALNAFLTERDTQIFARFEYEPIFNDPDFITFISPHFANQYQKAILDAFRQNSSSKLQNLFKGLPLLSKQDYTLAFRLLEDELKTRIDRIKATTQDITNNTSKYDTQYLPSLQTLALETLPLPLLTLLPSYFSTSILNAAGALNFLSKAIWETFDDTNVPNVLSEYILDFPITPMDRLTFESNHRFIKETHLEREQQRINAPALKPWNDLLNRLQTYSEQLENRTITAPEIAKRLSCPFSILPINSLASFADPIRLSIAKTVRSLSVDAWNKSTEPDAAILIIKVALEINVDPETRKQLEDDLKQLTEVSARYKATTLCHFCQKSNSTTRAEINKYVYKVTNRSYFPRSINFNRQSITIPRCDHCRFIHSKIKIWKWAIYAIPPLLWVVSKDLGQSIAVIILIIIAKGLIGLIATWPLALIFENMYSRKKGTKHLSHSYLIKHPNCAELFKQGYSFNEPNA
jgi:hypothetical protein